ncbi:ANTAR domain-containing protein [Streptomyces sp. NPDC002701]|uniref:ANTAR domain-containing protein n=1 Tax=Streptomyces sp. NPDC002701 TaxID=3364661 RepID=UPI00367B4494
MAGVHHTPAPGRLRQRHRHRPAAAAAAGHPRKPAAPALRRPALAADDLALAQALADAATIGPLHSRTLQRPDTVNEHLHTALQSRIVIEQAKGLLAARRAIGLNRAFGLMRRHAQDHRMLLSDVARDTIANGSALPAPPGRSEANPADAE